MNRDPILAVRNVSKTYYAAGNELPVIKNISVVMRAGEVLAIAGPSGSGKTTFLMIAGLVDVPTSGEVFFNGQLIATPDSKLNELRTFRRQHIGFVFQRPNLIPFLTARENVEVALQLNKSSESEAADRAWQLLCELGVDHRAESYPQQLSGGEQQRVAIARAFANEPVLIFADEPTGALDSARGRQVIELFRDAADSRGVAVCIVTHDLRSMELFDRVLEMNDGTIVAEAMPQ